MLSKVTVRIKWPKDSNSKFSVVYKKNENGLEELVRIYNNEIDTICVSNLEIGKEHHYIIRYFNHKHIYYDYNIYVYVNKKNYAIYNLPMPKIIKVEESKVGNKITWEKVDTDVIYLISRRVMNGKWERLVVTKNNMYVDKIINMGVRYFYTVSCINKDGKRISSFNSKGIMAQ